MHRAALGIEVGLRYFHAARAPPRCGGSIYRGQYDRDWARKIFEISDLPGRVSWEEFERKGYHIINAPEHRNVTPGLRWFAEGRACDTPDPRNPKRGTDKAAELGTDSGKIEFVSGSLQKALPTMRSGRPCALHSELGRPPESAGRQISAAVAQSASPLHLSHAL